MYRTHQIVQVMSYNIKKYFRRLKHSNTVNYYRFRIITQMNNFRNHIKYDAPASPYEPISVNARDIDQITGWYNIENPLRTPKIDGIGRVKSGNWDSEQYRTDVSQSYIIRGMMERFKKGLDWEDTAYYQMRYKDHKNNKKYKKRGYESVESYIQADCKSYDKLYTDIQENGYESSHQGKNRLPGRSEPVRDKLEVLVTIDRKGCIHFFDGYHRFGIARALDLEIPVQVAYRHTKWQQIRDKVYNDSIDAHQNKLCEHPDLQDILD